MNTISWRVPEFQYYKKELGWYWAVFIAGLLLVLFAFWQSNLLFAIFIGIATMMVIYWGKQKPRIILCRLTEEELEVNGKKSALGDFSGYYLDKKILVLRPKKRFGTNLKVSVRPEIEKSIREILPKKLPEVEYQESISDWLAHRLGF